MGLLKASIEKAAKARLLVRERKSLLTERKTYFKYIERLQERKRVYIRIKEAKRDRRLTSQRMSKFALDLCKERWNQSSRTLSNIRKDLAAAAAKRKKGHEIKTNIRHWKDEKKQAIREMEKAANDLKKAEDDLEHDTLRVDSVTKQLDEMEAFFEAVCDHLDCAENEVTKAKLVLEGVVREAIKEHLRLLVVLPISLLSFGRYKY